MLNRAHRLHWGALLLLPGLLVSGCGSSDTTGPGTAAGDLTIGYIQRLPELDYVQDAQDPTRQGWPAPGSQVVWRAHLKNWAGRSRSGVGYRWLLDGVEVMSGVVDLPAQGEGTVDFPWTWTFDRHRLALEIDPDDAFEEEPRNNHLEIFTDALSVGLYVERGIYDYFAAHQADLGVGSTCFEDWAQRQITALNDMLAAAVYPETPEGVHDRFRLDHITIVADGALPLVPVNDPNGATTVPNLNDRTVDIQWGFPATNTAPYADTHTVSTDNQFYYSGVLQHEMGHARYLVDVYGLDVYQGTAGDSIGIRESGAPVAGSNLMPGTAVNFDGVSGIKVYQAQQGLMHDDWTYLDRHSAGALNRIAGWRATEGNFVDPGNIGVYLNDLPSQNRLTVEDATGTPLPGAHVWLYRSERGSVTDNLAGHYRKYFDDAPDLELVADGQGRVLLGRDPFSSGAGVVLDEDFTNGTVIVRVEHEGKVGYGFLDVTGFNQAYWRGETDLADHVLKVRLSTTVPSAGRSPAGD